MKRFSDLEDATLPHEVVSMHVVEGMSLIKAWRKHLKLTQGDVAERLGITQSAYSQIEQSEKPHQATLDKLAVAMGISVDQLTDD